MVFSEKKNCLKTLTIESQLSQSNYYSRLTCEFLCEYGDDVEETPDAWKSYRTRHMYIGLKHLVECYNLRKKIFF